MSIEKVLVIAVAGVIAIGALALVYAHKLDADLCKEAIRAKDQPSIEGACGWKPTPNRGLPLEPHRGLEP